MRNKGGRALRLGVLGLIGLALAGCAPWVPRQGEPELILVYAPGSFSVSARVVGINGDLYIWNWGDGPDEETTTGTATHTYAQLGVYTVRVTVIRLASLGSGTPGPGTKPGREVVAELSGIVDLRPAVVLSSIAITVLNPPPWYDPRTWPEDAFPSSCSLEVTPVFERYRPGGPEPTRAVWTVFREGQFHLQVTGIPAVIPFEALYVGGCGVSYARYEIYVTVFMSDGTTLTGSRSIRICAPNGCR